MASQARPGQLTARLTPLAGDEPFRTWPVMVTALRTCGLNPRVAVAVGVPVAVDVRLAVRLAMAQPLARGVAVAVARAAVGVLVGFAVCEAVTVGWAVLVGKQVAVA